MLLYWIWFAELTDIQLWQKHILLQYFSDPEELYHARREAFLEIPDMTESILKALEEKGEGYEDFSSEFEKCIKSFRIK